MKTPCPYGKCRDSVCLCVPSEVRKAEIRKAAADKKK